MNEVKFQQHTPNHIGVQAPTGFGLKATSAALAAYVASQEEMVNTYVQLTGIYFEDALLSYWATIHQLDCVPIVPAGASKLSIQNKGQTVQVPIGSWIELKVVSAEDGGKYNISIQASLEQAEYTDEPYLRLRIKAPGLLTGIVEQFEATLRGNIATGIHSKVKGTIVSIEFPYRRGEGIAFNHARHVAKYEDCKGVLEDLVFNPATEKRINTQILQRLRRQDVLKGAAGSVRFQSNHMLVGGYGTGKSALVNAVMAEASSRGITCIFIKDARDLEFGNEWAQQYEPAILVVEDVNRLMESENDERTIRQDNLTNVLDGVSTKGRSLMTIFTVNDTERILPVFLRPGRMNSLIEMEPLAPEASLRLLGRVCNLTTKVDTSSWLDKLQTCGHQNPSTVVQIGVAAAILAQLADRNVVLPEDIMEAFEAMRLQLKLVNRAPRTHNSEREKAATILAQAIEVAAHEYNLPEEVQVPQIRRRSPAALRD